jgi:ring-1,2-phenylacetyl-CoA epoxidase subunit PaaC
MNKQDAIVEYCLRLGDNALVLGQRYSEWCGHGPVLEEDIAMSNLGLDLIGQARGFLAYAGMIEGKGRTEDTLAYRRDVSGFRNRMLVEQPNGDFAVTMMRAFLHGSQAYLQYRELMKSTDETISGLAAKSLKEMTYHVRHSSDWVIRLGDGTEESHRRMQDGMDDLWQYTSELFEMNEVDELLIKEGVACDLSAIRAEWDSMVKEVCTKATIHVPSKPGYQSTGGIRGLHTEHLGHLLTELQYLQRSYPDAVW